MNSDCIFNDTRPYSKLRKCILQNLFTLFKKYPYAAIELNHIGATCQITPEELNWNIVYLEKCGYIDLDKSNDCPPYISCTATITAKGIDLVEMYEKGE